MISYALMGVPWAAARPTVLVCHIAHSEESGQLTIEVGIYGLSDVDFKCLSGDEADKASPLLHVKVRVIRKASAEYENAAPS